MVLCVVIPAHNEQEVILHTYQVLKQKLHALMQDQVISTKSFLCFVDDGSKDKTWEILQELCDEMIVSTTAVKLSRNYGHQNALLAGLEYVADKCDCVISIDCDLQDDIGVFDTFIDKAKQGAEVIYGVRKSRHVDSFLKKNTAQGFYKLMGFMGVKITYNHADYRLMSSRAVRALLCFNEVNLFLRGIVPLLGFKSDVVEYDRLERFAGDSKYTLTKMLSFAWNGITSFSVVPLRIVSVLGVIFFVFSLGLGFYALCIKLFADGVIIGWASTIIPLCFFSGIQLLSLGVIGEYIGKIYAESKRRPRYFVEEVANPLS